MTKIRTITSIAIIMLVLSACGNATSGSTPQPGLETIVAGTLAALTPAVEDSPAPSFEGTAVTIDNVSFTIPTGLGSSAQAEKVEAIPGGGQDPYPTPAYTKYLIQGYPNSGAYLLPEIHIFPAKEFASVHPSAAKQISDLQILLDFPDQQQQYLPFLPIFNAAQVFHSNEQILSFQNGNGIRFVTMYSQAPNPVNNLGLFYTYQGLTDDGNYYVAIIMPIQHALLAESAQTDTQPPAGGISFDWSPSGFESYQTYINSVVQLLNSSDPGSFAPAISTLDALVQSISISQ